MEKTSRETANAPESDRTGRPARPPAFFVIGATVAACAVLVVGVFVAGQHLDGSEPVPTRTVADTSSSRLGPLLNAAPGTFLTFECAAPEGDCGLRAAEDYCRASGGTLVRWQAGREQAAASPPYRFSMTEVVCRMQ